MKTKILVLVIAIFGTALFFSQTANAQSNLKCEKKVVKQIKRSMNVLDVTDYVPENHKVHVILTFAINDDHLVDIVKIEGYDQKLNNAVKEILDRLPVKCDADPIGNQYTLLLTFKHLPV
ncbi:MAG: hypothetical protein K9H16_12145 [Bacteroidales bacterium]|nr:hypothetical protein [Bacteroidales bacterium]